MIANDEIEVKVDVVIMPLLVTPRSLNRVVALDQHQKLSLYNQQQLFTQIMSKCGSFVNGSQEESHSYDSRGAEEGKLIIDIRH